MNVRDKVALKVSVIITTHSEQRLPRLKNILDGLASQTYPHVEVVVVGNGVTRLEHSYLNMWANDAENRKFLPFSDNAWSWSDHSTIGRLRYRAGIQHSSGDLIFCQSDDDFVACDFFERIVNLFETNTDCMTAIGLPVDYYYEDNRVILPKDGGWCRRPRFMHGKDLVLNWIEDRSFHPNPGFCFVCRRSLFVEAGEDIWYGYDTSILLSLVPKGITGFDPEALMYWGRCKDQAHIELDDCHYQKLVYVEQLRKRNQLMLNVWTTVGTKVELRTLRTFQKHELANYSTKGILYAVKKKNLQLAFRHLRVGGFLAVIFTVFREMRMKCQKC